jgi:hypothetical protein
MGSNPIAIVGGNTAVSSIHGSNLVGSTPALPNIIKKMELYILNKFIFIYNNKIESNPGSVGRLGACLIHASLF